MTEIQREEKGRKDTGDMEKRQKCYKYTREELVGLFAMPFPEQVPTGGRGGGSTSTVIVAQLGRGNGALNVGIGLLPARCIIDCWACGHLPTAEEKQLEPRYLAAVYYNNKAQV